MRVKLDKDKFMVKYPFAKNIDFDSYYLVNGLYKDGVVNIIVYNGLGVPHFYTLPKDMYIRKKECSHRRSKDDICLACSDVPFETETRPCSECTHYKTHTDMWPHCSKKLVNVTSTMLAHYYAKDGTCFERAKESILTTETRPCEECLCYTTNARNESGCSKYSLDVSYNDQICYLVKDSTCFRVREEDIKC
jgi:hypothetical protein